LEDYESEKYTLEQEKLPFCMDLEPQKPTVSDMISRKLVWKPSKN
jgi:hypothetical protein